MLAQDKINDLRQFDLFKELDCQTLEQLVPNLLNACTNEMKWSTQPIQKPAIFSLY